MINELRQAIIQRLSPLNDQAKIIGDDTDGEANPKITSDYVIRVGYSGGQFDQPPTTEMVSLQTGNKSFEVSIEIKDLRNETKTVELLENVEHLLIGFCPCVDGATGEFYLQSDRFVRNQNGIYYYVISIAVLCFLLKR
jgi:hypothetical protein